MFSSFALVRTVQEMAWSNSHLYLLKPFHRFLKVAVAVAVRLVKVFEFQVNISLYTHLTFRHLPCRR